MAAIQPQSVDHPEKGRKSLAGHMGVTDIVFTVLAFNAPLSVFVGFITVIIGYGNGLGAPITYLGCGALMLLFAVGFTTMARFLPNPGAFYAYISAGLGRPAGLGASFVALVSYFFILIGGYAFGGLSLQTLVRDVFGGPSIDWFYYTMFAMALVGVLGYFRIALSAKILTVFMACEVVVILAYNLVTLGQGGASGINFDSFTPTAITSGSVGLAILFGITCFSGFEATAIFREEAKDPERTVPRATYLAIIFMATMYALSSWAIIVGIGNDKVIALASSDPTGAALGTVSVYLGNAAMDVVVVLLATSILAANIATHNVTTRYIYSLSVDQILPRFLSVVHETEASPHRASILTSGISYGALVSCIIFGGAASTLYAVLVGIGGYALIMLLLLTSTAVFAYFRKNRDLDTDVWHSVVAPVAASAGLLFAFYLATKNVTAMIGGSQTLANLLIALYFTMLLLGIVVASVLRSRRPDIYARIGRQEV